MRRRGRGEGGLTKRHDGRWQASFVGSDNRRHYLYAATRREAAEKLGKALRDKAMGVYVAGKSQTVETFMASWLRDAATRLRPRTHERYEGQIRLHVLPALGALPIGKVTPQHLADLYARVNLSGASKAHLHRVLHSAFDTALKWHLVGMNPCSAVRPPKAQRRRMDVLTPDEAKRLLHAVEGDELEALYVLAVTCGLRQGELLALRWRDVDLEDGWLDVNATLSRGERLQPKTRASTRKVKMGELAQKALRKHRLRMAEALIPYRGRTEGDTLVFLTALAEPLHGGHLTERAFKPLLKRAGIRPIRFHDLRHAFASLMLSQGVRVDLVSQMLGHSSPAITLGIYAHLMPGDQEEAVRRLDVVLGA